MQNKNEKLALKVLKEYKVAIFIVAYNAANHIENVLSRIPTYISELTKEIYIIDDSSSDNTISKAKNINWDNNFAALRIYKTPFNQGYGGNQKIGYLYAIKKEFDIVILLHGDGQYAPEALPNIIASYADINIKAVYGSRFINARSALKGGMPLYKFFGNIILTNLQNKLMKSNLSEWHSGYRSYRTSLLKEIPFEFNSNDFDFDSEIIIQIIGSGEKILEIEIPTYYGDEICRVNGIQYALKCIKNLLQYKLMELELFYDPKFDLMKKAKKYSYTRKESETSLHHYIRSMKIKNGIEILDIGGGDGRAVAQDLYKKGAKVTVIDQFKNKNKKNYWHINLDLDEKWSTKLNKKFDTVIALDVIEHLKNPEDGLKKIALCMYEEKSRLYISTGNIAFLPLRIMLLLGYFNYGRKGILDKTHKRLFTINSLKRTLKQANFEILETLSFGPPIKDLSGSTSIFVKFLDILFFKLSRALPNIFSYQFLIIAKRKFDLENLQSKTTD